MKAWMSFAFFQFVQKAIRTLFMSVLVGALMFCLFSVGFHTEVSAWKHLIVWMFVLVISVFAWWIYFIWTWSMWQGGHFGYRHASSFLVLASAFSISIACFALAGSWFFQVFDGSRLYLAMSVGMSLLIFVLRFVMRHVRGSVESDYSPAS